MSPTTGLDPGGRRTAWELVRSSRLGGHHGGAHDPLHGRGRGLGRPGRRSRPRPHRRLWSATSLGGRDVRGARSASGCRRACSRGDLPVAPVGVDGVVEVRTDEEVAVLARLTDWALGRGVDAPGLTVSRTTLEDVYLRPDPRRAARPGRTGGPHERARHRVRRRLRRLGRPTPRRPPGPLRATVVLGATGSAPSSPSSSRSSFSSCSGPARATRGSTSSATSS